MITERAMLAAVHISIWTAVKHDRKISRDVASQHGAHRDAGRYNKQLLRGADKLDELRTLAGQIRQYFYRITLPWSDEGFRLLPSNFYFDLMARIAGCWPMRSCTPGFTIMSAAPDAIQGDGTKPVTMRSIPCCSTPASACLTAFSSTIASAK
jgi:hypothetical protein